MRDSDNPTLVSMLYERAPTAVLASVVNAFLLALAGWEALGPYPLSIWMAGMLILAFVRMRMVSAFRRQRSGALPISAWANRYLYSALFSGLLWGAAGIMLIGTHRLELQVFSAFILGGMTAGAVATNVPNRAVFFAYALPALAPLPLLFFLEGGRLHLVMALLTLMFLLLMSRAALRSHHTLRRSIELAQDNERLLDKMRTTLGRLEESEAQYRNMFELNPLMYFTLDAAGTIYSVNSVGASQLGYTVAELTGKPVSMLLPADAQPVVNANLALCLDELNTVHTWETVKVRKDGSRLWVRGTAVAIQRQEHQPSVLVMCEDITEKKKAEEQIHHLAYFDPLTNLPNRRLFMDRLGQALIASNRSREYGALMILDLDNFKTLNDTQGHDVGDRLLMEVAKRLQTVVRQEDSVARLGGDEYVVMVEGLGTDESFAANQAEKIAEKMRQALNQPFSIDHHRQAYSSTTSIGLTLFRDHEASIDVLFKQADVALYQAKDAGRNAIRFFNPLMQAAIDARSAMEAALRRALQQDELRIHYQPQVDLNGRLIGAEALLRWFPSGLEPVSPAEFIPLAEQTGLILPIGQWVLDTACAQLKAWEDHPDTRLLQLSINVSARQFRQDDFVAQVRRRLASHGANPARLKLELTESVVLDNVEEVIDRMRQLNALGVGFSLDDFGTGYSSLSYLKRLPLDQVKIDQSFVRDIPVDQNDAAIVRAILAMSQSLGIQVIAEGVETPEQRVFLLENGCKAFQGYLFGRPMPIEEWEDLLQAEVS